MKNLFLFFVCLSLLSCEDYTLAEKEILVKNIKLYDFYEPILSVLKTQNGFYLQLQKSITNGDSTKCEVYARTSKILTKIDWNGRTIWSKEIKDMAVAIPYNYAFDDKQNIYSYNNSPNGILIKYDTVFNILEQKSILLKDYTKTESYLSGWTYLKDGKFLGYGSLSINGNTKVKTFFCIMSIENGIEKFVFDDTEFNQYRTIKYSVLPDGKIYGVEQYIEGEKTFFDIREYSSDLKLISSKIYTENVLLVSDISKIKVSKDWITILGQNSKSNEVTVFSINKKFEVQKKQIGIAKQGNVSFLDTNDENTYIALNTNPAEIWTVEGGNLSKIDEIDTKTGLNSYSCIVRKEANQNVLYAINLETINKPKFSFLKKTTTSTLKTTTLYESQYKRKCIRWME